MTSIKKLLLICTLASFIGCGQSENKSSSASNSEKISAGGGSADLNLEVPTGAVEKNIPAEPKAVIEQKLIKNGEISFETKGIKQTKAFLQSTVTKYNGYISKEQIEDYRTSPSEVITVRVPNINFDKMINDISLQVGEFDTKKIDIDDVTAEFVDIEARLKNKKQLETKYQELLTKANKIDDILRIEQEISVIREDIESTEGRMRYLSNQVGYSTLIITYYEKRATSGFNFGGKLGDAIMDGGTGFLWFLIGLAHLWPLWFIGGIIWYAIYKIVKHRKNAKLKQKTINQN